MLLQWPVQILNAAHFTATATMLMLRIALRCVDRLCGGRHAHTRALILGSEDSHTVWRSAPGGDRATLDSGYTVFGWTVANVTTGGATPCGGGGRCG